MHGGAKRCLPQCEAGRRSRGGAIAAEIVKAQINTGQRREVYSCRDQQRLEGDCIVPTRRGVRSMESKPPPKGSAPETRRRPHGGGFEPFARRGLSMTDGVR